LSKVEKKDDARIHCGRRVHGSKNKGGTPIVQLHMMIKKEYYLSNKDADGID